MARDNTPQYLKQNIKVVQILLKEYLEYLRERLRQTLLQRRYDEINSAAYNERDPAAVYERDIARIQADPMRYKVYGCLDNDNIDVVRGILRSKDIPFSFQDATEEGRGGFYLFEAVHEREFLNAVNEYNKQLEGLSKAAAAAKRQKIAEEGRDGSDDRERVPDTNKKKKGTRSFESEQENSTENSSRTNDREDSNDKRPTDRDADTEYEQRNETHYEDDEEIIESSTEKVNKDQSDHNGAESLNESTIDEQSAKTPEDLTNDTSWLIGEEVEDDLYEERTSTAEDLDDDRLVGNDEQVAIDTVDNLSYTEELLEESYEQEPEYDQQEPYEYDDEEIIPSVSEEVNQETNTEIPLDQSTPVDEPFVENPEELAGNTTWIDEEIQDDPYEERGNPQVDLNNDYSAEQNEPSTIEAVDNSQYLGAGEELFDANYGQELENSNQQPYSDEGINIPNPADEFIRRTVESSENRSEVQPTVPESIASPTAAETFEPTTQGGATPSYESSQFTTPESQIANNVDFGNHGTESTLLHNTDVFQHTESLREQESQKIIDYVAGTATAGVATAAANFTQAAAATQEAENKSFGVASNIGDLENQFGENNKGTDFTSSFNQNSQFIGINNHVGENDTGNPNGVNAGYIGGESSFNTHPGVSPEMAESPGNTNFNANDNAVNNPTTIGESYNNGAFKGNIDTGPIAGSNFSGNESGQANNNQFNHRGEVGNTNAVDQPTRNATVTSFDGGFNNGGNNPQQGSSGGGITFESSFSGGQIKATSHSSEELNVYDSGNAFDIDPYGGVVDHKSLIKAPEDFARAAMDGGDKDFVKKGLKDLKKTGAGDLFDMSTYTATGAMSHGVTEGNLTNRTMQAFDDVLGKDNKELLVEILGIKNRSKEEQIDAITNFMERGHLINKNKLTGKYESKGVDWEYNRSATPIGRRADKRTAQALFNDRNAEPHYATSGEYTASNLKKLAAQRGRYLSNEKAAELANDLSRAGTTAADHKDMSIKGKTAAKKGYKKLKAMMENPDDTTTQELNRWNGMYGTVKQGVDIFRQGRAILTNQLQGRAQRRMAANAARMRNARQGSASYREASEAFDKYRAKNDKYERILNRINEKRERARKGVAERLKERTGEQIKTSGAYKGLKNVGGKLKTKALKIKPIGKTVQSITAIKNALGVGKTASEFLASGGNVVVFAIKKVAEVLINLVTNFTELVEKAKKLLMAFLAALTAFAVISLSGLFLVSGIGMAICSVFLTYGTMFDINEDGEGDTASEEAIKESTYGIVYEELKKEEKNWFTNLIREMQNKQYMSVSDTSYTDTSNLGAQMGVISGEQSGASGQVTDSTPPTNLNIIENAGQTPVAATEAEIFLLAQVINNEAAMESYQTQVGVAEVIINRVKSSRFKGVTITEIINQKGQFSDLDRAKRKSAAEVAAQIPIARAVVSGNLRIFNNPNILFFCNPKYVKGLKVNAATRKDWKGCGTWYAGISDTAFYYGNNNATDTNYGFSGQVVPTTTIKNASDYATQNLGTTYQDGGFKGPAPFANAPEEAYKNITIIDGEQSLVFRDANGNYGCKSNLRQILSMAMTAQEQTDNFEDNVDEDTFELLTSDSMLDRIKGVFSAITKTVQAAVNAIKNFVSNVINAVFPSFQQWWQHHEAKKRAKVVMAYCKPLFDLSHQNEFSESMSIHPTLRTLKNSGINKEEYDGEICNGNEAQNSDAMDAHNGYGCMSYNKFFYRDDNDTDVSLSENGELVMEVEPAGAHTGNDGTIPCSAPDGNADAFLARLDANPDCWDVSVGSEYESDSGAGGHSGSSVIDSAVGGNYHYSVSGSGASYTVTVQTAHHVSHDEDGDIDDEWYDLIDVTVTHHCSGTHTGYYCGGHLDNNIQSVITTWTDAEENQRAGEYFSKVTDSKTYKIADDYAAPTNEELQAANDLFDIDMLITHMKGTVYQEKDKDGNITYQFEGWTLDNMDLATTKFSDDWNKMYPGIKWEDEITVSAEELGIGGTGTASGSGSINTGGRTLSDAEITAALELAMSQIPDSDPVKADRQVAMQTALFYVGKVSYSQAYHGTKLTVGGQNDCSGYASQCWINKLKTTYSTYSFQSTFKGIMRRFSDGQCKPGDILLHFHSKGNHALIYMGKDSSGHNISVDESSPCSQYRNRSEAYYNECYYIPMEKFA